MARAPSSSSAGATLPAQIGRERAAAGEHAARDALLQARHHARDLGKPRLPCRSARSRASAPRRAGPACRDGAASGTARATGASSTLRPAYITMTRSATSATTPRSCVIRMMAAPTRRLRSRIRSRICAWMVTSSAVVGSSAISSFGLQASAIAIITRWRMPPDSWCGYSRDAPLRLGDADQAQHLDGARFVGLARSRPWCSRSVSPICRPTVSTGLRLVIGSWKIMRDVVAADVAHLALGELQQVACPGSGSSRRSCRAARGSAAGSTSAVTDLPQPDSPTIASVSPSLDLEGDAVDRAVDAVRRAEMGLQVLDLEQRHRIRPSLLGHARDRARRAGRRRAG